MNFASPRIRASNNDDSMIPLINIVFLLLIFFMVAGTITASDAVMISPPTSQAQSPVTSGQTVIIIGHDHEIYLGNHLISKHELSVKLALMQENSLGQNAVTGITDREVSQTGEALHGLRVLIKADGQLMMSELQDILACVKQAGIAQISLATTLSNSSTPTKRYEL